MIEPLRREPMRDAVDRWADALSPLEAANVLGVSRRQVYRFIAEGKLAATRPSPRATRIDRASVNAMLNAGVEELRR